MEQNLMLASLACGKRAARIRAAEVSEMFGIIEHLSVPASELPYGLRRLVEVARAMMSKPRVVLLDEPGAGLTDQERADLAPLLRLLADQGLAVLLVDHNVSFVVESCVRLVVLDAGVVIAEGTPVEIRNNPAVVEAYLGRSA